MHSEQSTTWPRMRFYHADYYARQDFCNFLCLKFYHSTLSGTNLFSQFFVLTAVCDMCIARFDHHCSFLNVCVGKYNYRYFVLLLLSLVLMCGVSSFVISMVFIHIVDLKDLHLAQFTDRNGMVHQASVSTVLQVSTLCVH